jgi:hypothetical protein
LLALNLLDVEEEMEAVIRDRDEVLMSFILENQFFRFSFQKKWIYGKLFIGNNPQMRLSIGNF